MGFEVMLTVQAEFLEAAPLVEIAQKYPRWDDLSNELRYADDTAPFEFFCFMRDVVAEKVFFYGNKSDALLWGGVYNYAHGEEFCDHLGSFMAKCPEQWCSNVIVTWEREQSHVRHGRLLWTTRRVGFDAEPSTDENRAYSVDMPPDFYSWHIGAPNGPPGATYAKKREATRVVYVSWDGGCHETFRCPNCCRLTEVVIEPETVGPSARCVNCKQSFTCFTVWKHR